MSVFCSGNSHILYLLRLSSTQNVFEKIVQNKGPTASLIEDTEMQDTHRELSPNIGHY